MDFPYSSCNFIPMQNGFLENSLATHDNCAFSPLFSPLISQPSDNIYETQHSFDQKLFHDGFLDLCSNLSRESSTPSFEIPTNSNPLSTLPFLPLSKLDGFALERRDPILNFHSFNNVVIGNESLQEATNAIHIEISRDARRERMMKTQRPLRIQRDQRKSGRWDQEEDIHLMELVNQIGEQKWNLIGKMMGNRTGKQCRERWLNQLRPDIKKDKSWTKEEERIMVETHKQMGNRWATIARKLPGRTECSVKNHWNATKRKLQTSVNVKADVCSPLSQYIINLVVGNV